MSAPSDPNDRHAPAWLHDGQSAQRHETAVAVEGELLTISGFAPVPLASLRRLDGAGLLYGHKDIAGWRLGFDVAPPAAILWRLPAAAQYGGLIDRIGLWRAAAVLIVLSGLALVAAVQGFGLIARAIPYSWEQKLGDAISGDFGEHACRASAGQQALDGLARRLSPASQPIRIGVVDIPVVNAVALPGGRILIFRGLIDEARSPDEVAGVLAHEIGHVEHRHVLVALFRRFGIGLLIGSGGTAADYGQALIDSRYSRAAESEADDYSIAQLRVAGISPAATAALFRRLGKDEAGLPGVFAYMASHPPSADRQRRFDMAAKAMAGARPALDPAQWAAVRAMCGKAKPKGDFPFRF